MVRLFNYSPAHDGTKLYCLTEHRGICVSERLVHGSARQKMLRLGQNPPFQSQVQRRPDQYVILKWHDVLFVCVYMPCKGTANYQDSYCDISVVIRDNAHRWLILGGDLNLDFTSSGPLTT